MNIIVGAGGKRLLEEPQQVWRNEDSILPSAIFAGKAMFIIEGGEDGSGGFELVYLDFKSSRFPTKEIAILSRARIRSSSFVTHGRFN